MKNWRLPSDKSAAWNGGFVLADPGYVHAIGVGQGTVVGAGEVLCRLLPGAAGFSVREVTTETGDFEAVAVERRRSGRIALAPSTRSPWRTAGRQQSARWLRALTRP